jgi:hypothetical protein
MKHDIQISYQDYKAAQRLHMAPRRRFRILLCILIACFGLAYILDISAVIKGESGRWLFVCAGLFAYFFLLFGVWLPRRWKKTYDGHKLLHRPYQFEITEEAFCSASEYGNATIPWREFHKWKEGKKLFLVYQSDHVFHVIPKRIFESPEAEENFRNLLRNALGNGIA